MESCNVGIPFFYLWVSEWFDINQCDIFINFLRIYTFYRWVFTDFIDGQKCLWWFKKWVSLTQNQKIRVWLLKKQTETLQFHHYFVFFWTFNKILRECFNATNFIQFYIFSIKKLNSIVYFTLDEILSWQAHLLLIVNFRILL